MKKEIKLLPEDNLESTVYTLLAAKARGEDVYCDFNGHKLYSNNVTMDSAYIEIVGCTKNEYELQKERLRDKKRSIKKMKVKNKVENVANWIKRGKAIIYPEKNIRWERCVIRNANDLYNNKELNSALEIMEAIEEGASMEEAKIILDSKNYSRGPKTLVRNIVFLFSNKGPEFMETVLEGKIDQKTRQRIKDQKEENMYLAAAHTKIEQSVRRI